MGALNYLLYHAVFVSVSLLLALSLTQLWKANLFSLGHHGFYAIGAYFAAACTKFLLSGELSWAMTNAHDRLVGSGILLLSIAVGGAFAGLIALILGTLLTRLRADYFAVATLVFAEIVQSCFANWKYVGGGLGLEVPYLVATNTRSESLLFSLFFLLLAGGSVAILFWALLRYQRSVQGLAVDSVREDEIAAEASGVDPRQLQVRVFVAASAVAGTAGGIFLHFTCVIIPTDFSFIGGVPIVVYAVLANGRFGRCIFVTTIAYCAYELLKAQVLAVGGELGQRLSDWKDTLFAIVLIGAIILPPVVRKLSIDVRSRFTRVGGQGRSRGDR